MIEKNHILYPKLLLFLIFFKWETEKTAINSLTF